MNFIDPSTLKDTKSLETQMGLSLSHYRELESQINDLRGLSKYHVAYVTLTGYYLISTISELKLLLSNLHNTTVLLGEVYVVVVLFMFLLISISVSSFKLILVLRPIHLHDAPPPSYRFDNFKILVKDKWTETKAWNISTCKFIKEIDKVCVKNKLIIDNVHTQHKLFVNWAIVVMVVGFVLMTTLTIIV